MMNRVSARTLMTTRIALTVADSRVPITSSQVTRPAMSIAGRFITPPSNGPSTRVDGMRSEEHTSELQSLMRTSYAVLCLTQQITAISPTIRADEHLTG